MENIFNKIINKEIEADIVFENEKVIAFKDINPVAPIHVLIIPKKNIKTINDIQSNDKELMGELFLVAKKIAKDYNIDKNGYRLIFNCNDDAGQTVFHIHMHLLAGRKLSWPPG